MPQGKPLVLPKKVTYYGGPDDDYVKIVETYEQDVDGVVTIDREAMYKKPCDYISISFTIKEPTDDG